MEALHHDLKASSSTSNVGLYASASRLGTSTANLTNNGSHCCEAAACRCVKIDHLRKAISSYAGWRLGEVAVRSLPCLCSLTNVLQANLQSDAKRKMHLVSA